MRYSSVKDFEKALSGGEPSWKNGEISLTRALNWYNYHSDTKESKKFTLSYLKEIKADKNLVEILEKVSDEHFQNLGFVCRMKLRGAPLNQKNENWIKSFIDNLKTKSKISSSDTENTTTVNIQERVAEKSANYIGEIEGVIDDCLCNNNFDISFYDFMQGLGVKGAHTSHIIKFFKKRLEELDMAISGEDKDLKEGYSHLTKTKLKNFHKLISSIIEDANKLAHNAKVSRKPRKKKSKPVEKVVSKLQYKKEDNGFKIVSINSSDIVGSSQLWIFNTKTRKLGVYSCEDSSGLSVKGTTIINFNEKTSVQKTLRKPEEILPKVLKGGKVILKKLLPEINAVEQPLTGRINSDTILLRVIK